MSNQLSFSLRTSTNVKTVHLLGSWDNYAGQLPLSKDSSKAGSWKGNFRFQSSMLKSGQRYWYYYIMDGYHVSHDPAKPSTTEPTTGRQLNVLDVGKSGSTTTASSKRASAHATVEIPTGRGLSPSRIVHPKPSKPYASRAVREADYSRSPVDDLTGQLEKATLYSPYSGSPASSVGSSLSSRSSGNSSPSSLSSVSMSDGSRGSRCSCNRYGITRKGDKVLLDCGGARCGYSDDSSSGCSSSDESNSDIESSEAESDDEPVRRRSSHAVKPKIQTIAPKRSAAVSSRRR